MGEEKKRTAREIIENYDGAAVRIMEVHTRYFDLAFANFCHHRWN